MKRNYDRLAETTMKLKMSCALILIMLTLSGCFTTKRISFESSPPDALIVRYGTGIGKTPLEHSETFFNDDDTVNITAEKRGYVAASQVVTKNSPTTIMFKMERIEGVPEAVFNKEQLKTGTFTLLPPDIDIEVLSGLRSSTGEYSPEKSREVTDAFNAELAKALQAGNPRIRFASPFTEAAKTDWDKLLPELKKYLSRLKSERLPYYSRPPYISAMVDSFETLQNRLLGDAKNASPYLLFIWGKGVSVSGGRTAGRIALSLLPTTPVLSPESSGALFVFYVIDAKTSEVLYMDSRHFPEDITESDKPAEAAKTAAAFPEITEKEVRSGMEK